MNTLIVVLRLVHIVLGALWVGMFAFITFFLTPAVAKAGPEGGKIMAALQRRKIMIVLPLLALLTIVSGVWLILGCTAAWRGSWPRTPAKLSRPVGRWRSWRS